MKGFKAEEPALKTSDLSQQTLTELAHFELLLRDLVMIKLNSDLVINLAWQSELQQLAGRFSLTDLRRLLELLQQLRQRLNQGANVQLAWENFLINLTP